MSIKTIRLYGELGEKFGRVWRLDVKSPAEALHALQVMIPGMRQYFAQNARKNFRIVAGKEDRDARDLYIPSSSSVFKVIPLIAGAGAGVRIVVGAILMFIGTYFAIPPITQIGFSMVMSGVAQALTKTPKINGQSVDRPENRPSYAFDGAVNTAAQGNPVSICYGMLIVGSQVISAGLSTEQVAA